jgi:pyruvate dehydrogenase E2 component (dihydrolipoamide acetyltransferase)
MAIPVEMPKLGNTVEECILAKWKKNKGDTVTNGEIIADIETDKATFELAAPADGTLLETFFAEGALVPVFTNVCVIGGPGEDLEQFRPKETVSQQAPSVNAPPASSPAPASRQVPAARTPGMLSPRARRFASEHGIAPPSMAGSGPGGRVLEEDLREFQASGPKFSSHARKRLLEGFEANREGSGVGGLVLANDLDTPPELMSGVRKRTAERMCASLATTAQYTMNTSADATALLALRARIKEAAAQAVPDININEILMFCTVKALVEMPQVNVAVVDGKIYRHAAIHLGFACDTEKGLLVPVLRDAQKLSLVELAVKTKALARAASEGSVSVDDLTGATFTVSNLGNLGIESFTPILNPPQAAILGIDAITLRPVRRSHGVEFVDYIGLSLTCDHQIIDGAPGARFLKLLKQKIEAVDSIVDLKL